MDSTNVQESVKRVQNDASEEGNSCNVKRPKMADQQLDDVPTASGKNKQYTVLYKVKAQFDYISSLESELTFNAGDVISVTENLSDDWARGFIEQGQEVKLFPGSFTQRMTENDVTLNNETPNTGITKTVLYKVRACFDYDGDEDDLSFKEGDVLNVAEEVDEGWALGFKDGDLDLGLFPRNYVAKC